jgi:hypothetical protein
MSNNQNSKIIKDLLRIKDDCSWQESIISHFAKEERKIIHHYRSLNSEMNNLSDLTLVYMSYQDISDIISSFKLNRKITELESKEYFKLALNSFYSSSLKRD